MEGRLSPLEQLKEQAELSRQGKAHDTAGAIREALSAGFLMSDVAQATGHVEHAKRLRKVGA